ncbi:MAG: threonine synthase [Burkholderiales bacterium]|nr:threonine synthase [Burkholderiales bacterium]
MKFKCFNCGELAPASQLTPNCQKCGGLFTVDFEPPAWNESLIDKSIWSLFRYRKFLAIEGEYWKNITMGEGMTPCVPYDEDLLLKMDYMMPTLSFKDRGAVALVSHMKAIGVTKCVQDSSGNAGIAVAAYCARAGIECEIMVPEGTSPNKIKMIEGYGAKGTVVPGSRDHCADVCREKVIKEGWYYANHVYNPTFYEGTKTYIYEVLELLGRIPKNLFIELGNGTQFIGAVLALEHLQKSGAIDEFPQIIAIQSEKCAPFFETLKAKSDKLVDIVPEPTLAEGIAIGKPARADEILRMFKDHKIRIVTAPEDKIPEAKAKLARKGFYVEPTTAAALAAYERYCESYGRTPDSLIQLCSSGIKTDH